MLIVQLGFVDVTAFFPAPGQRLLIRRSSLVTCAMHPENEKYIVYINVRGHTLRVCAGLDGQTAQQQFTAFDKARRPDLK